MPSHYMYVHTVEMFCHSLDCKLFNLPQDIRWNAPTLDDPGSPRTDSCKSCGQGIDSEMLDVNALLQEIDLRYKGDGRGGEDVIDLDLIRALLKWLELDAARNNR